MIARILKAGTSEGAKKAWLKRHKAKEVAESVTPPQQAPETQGENKAADWSDVKAAQQPKKVAGKAQAPAGGMDGVNGYFYQGGQFLPSTEAPPGSFTIGKNKFLSKGAKLVGPGKFEMQPTPISQPLFKRLGPGYFTMQNSLGKLEVNKGANADGLVRDYDGNPVTRDYVMSERALGKDGKMTKLTLGEMIDAYNDGNKWFSEVPKDIELSDEQMKEVKASHEANLGVYTVGNTKPKVETTFKKSGYEKLESMTQLPASPEGTDKRSLLPKTVKLIDWALKANSAKTSTSEFVSDSGKKVKSVTTTFQGRFGATLQNVRQELKNKMGAKDALVFNDELSSYSIKIDGPYVSDQGKVFISRILYEVED